MSFAYLLRLTPKAPAPSALCPFSFCCDQKINVLWIKLALPILPVVGFAWRYFPLYYMLLYLLPVLRQPWYSTLYMLLACVRP